MAKLTLKITGKEKLGEGKFLVKGAWSDGIKDEMEVQGPTNAQEAADLETLIQKTFRERRPEA